MRVRVNKIGWISLSNSLDFFVLRIIFILEWLGKRGEELKIEVSNVIVWRNSNEFGR